MADLREARQKLTGVIIVLLVLDVIAAVLLIRPIGGSPAARQQQLNQLWNELQAKTRETVPLEGIDKKVEEAKKEIATFYKDRLPGQNSAISEKLGKLASQYGIRIATVNYEVEDTVVRDLRRVSVRADLEGDYLQEVKFINALERETMLFVVDSVALGEDQGGKVKLQVKFETFLKSAA
jgi:hypothetical protein